MAGEFGDPLVLPWRRVRGAYHLPGDYYCQPPLPATVDPLYLLVTAAADEYAGASTGEYRFSIVVRRSSPARRKETSIPAYPISV